MLNVFCKKEKWFSNIFLELRYRYIEDVEEGEEATNSYKIVDDKLQ
jgi:hypothetical protein